MSDGSLPPKAPAMAFWLMACAAMVFVMVILGGATRLTGSGLSMVEWKPLTALPPLDQGQWQAAFDNYRQFPEFLKKNSWMTVDDFKGIYWLEYLHRLWGRLIGVAFALPFLWFWFRGSVTGSLRWQLPALLVLGGLQGGLGWFMVASGLQDRPDVSQYRLAAHLVMAFVLYAGLLWVALDLFSHGQNTTPHGDPGFARLTFALPAFVLLVVTAGAFVAGLDAGLTYNTFPLMDGRLVPAGVLSQSPWYSNFFENVATVQFEHRVLAIALAIYVGYCWLRSRRAHLSVRGRTAITAVAVMTIIQLALGISTLLLVVPLPLALVHQAGALVPFTFSLWLAHEVQMQNAHRPLTMQSAE